MSRHDAQTPELDLNRKLLRRRVWMTRVAIGLALTGAILIACDYLGWFGHRGSDRRAFAGKQFVVSHVLDGQTLMLQIDWAQQQRVRLLGVYAPRGASEDGSKLEHFSTESTRYVSSRAAGQRVTIQFDELATRDEDGVLVAYAYLSDSEMLNLAMVRAGMAYADRRVKHSMSRQFEQAENEARTRRVGLWKMLKDDEMPEWRKQWLQSRTSDR